MLVALSVCMFVISGCFGQGHDAVYTLIFESGLYVMGDGSDDRVDTSNVICERYNDSIAVMHGDLEFKQDLNPNNERLIVVIILKKEASGKHEVLFSHDICDLCSELGNAEGNYIKYLGKIKIPDHCPFEAGIYKIENLTVDVTEFEIKDSQCGPYLAEVYVYKTTGDDCKKDRELLFIIKLDLSIERVG